MVAFARHFHTIASCLTTQLATELFPNWYCTKTSNPSAHLLFLLHQQSDPSSFAGNAGAELFTYGTQITKHRDAVPGEFSMDLRATSAKRTVNPVNRLIVDVRI